MTLQVILDAVVIIESQALIRRHQTARAQGSALLVMPRTHCLWTESPVTAAENSA